MSATAPAHHEVPFEPFDSAVEATVGGDFRLLYGMVVPMLMVVGLVIVLGVHTSWWLVSLVVVVELGCLGLVITKILGILDEPEDEEPPVTH